MSNIQNDFISGIGNTPLIKLKAASEITGCNIYGKAEFLNPGGSVKDRAALALIKDAQDKKLNLKTLFSLGATIEEIKRIFVYQGFLLTFLGMIIGLSLGILLVFLQKQFGLFMITQNLPYPVEFRISNLFIVVVTITVLGFIASKIASSRINKDFIEK